MSRSSRVDDETKTLVLIGYAHGRRSSESSGRKIKGVSIDTLMICVKGGDGATWDDDDSLVILETFFDLSGIITWLVRLLCLRRKAGGDGPQAHANRREPVPGHCCTNALQ